MSRSCLALHAAAAPGNAPWRRLGCSAQCKLSQHGNGPTIQSSPKTGCSVNLRGFSSEMNSHPAGSTATRREHRYQTSIPAASHSQPWVGVGWDGLTGVCQGSGAHLCTSLGQSSDRQVASAYLSVTAVVVLSMCYFRTDSMKHRFRH